MRKQLIVLLAGLVGAVTLGGQAEAQVRPWEISIAGGPSFATGDFSDVVDTGYHVQGSVGFDPPLLPIGLRADLFWQELPSATDANDDWARQIGVHANAIFEMPFALIQPYGLAGIGIMNSSVTGDSVDEDSEATVGFNAGVGVEFPFVGLGGFVEARYLNIFGNENASDLRTIPVTVGIRF
ncbi:MAG: outer membrane beta-barrel protein [Gemmatimonas sp.]|nr:outer membrane beta-barrel protein [Gemmatimonas sp.]